MAKIALAANQRLPIRDQPVQHSIEGFDVLQQAWGQCAHVIA